MLEGGHGISFEETTSEDDGGSDCESDVGGSGQEPARVVEQGWTDFGLDVFGKFLFGPLGAFPYTDLNLLGRVLILATLVTLAGAVLAVYPDGEGDEGVGGSLWSGVESEDFGLEVMEGSGAEGRGTSRAANVLASLGVTWLGGTRTSKVVAALLLLDSVAAAPILVIWPSTGTGRVTSTVWASTATEGVTSPSVSENTG